MYDHQLWQLEALEAHTTEDFRVLAERVRFHLRVSYIAAAVVPSVVLLYLVAPLQGWAHLCLVPFVILGLVYTSSGRTIKRRSEMKLLSSWEYAKKLFRETGQQDHVSFHWLTREVADEFLKDNAPQPIADFLAKHWLRSRSWSNESPTDWYAVLNALRPHVDTNLQELFDAFLSSGTEQELSDEHKAFVARLRSYDAVLLWCQDYPGKCNLLGQYGDPLIAVMRLNKQVSDRELLEMLVKETTTPYVAITGEYLLKHGELGPDISTPREFLFHQFVDGRSAYNAVWEWYFRCTKEEAKTELRRTHCRGRDVQLPIRAYLLKWADIAQDETHDEIYDRYVIDEENPDTPVLEVTSEPSTLNADWDAAIAAISSDYLKGTGQDSDDDTSSHHYFPYEVRDLVREYAPDVPGDYAEHWAYAEEAKLIVAGCVAFGSRLHYWHDLALHARGERLYVPLEGQVTRVAVGQADSQPLPAT